jgi:hypothetical protein
MDIHQEPILLGTASQFLFNEETTEDVESQGQKPGLCWTILETAQEL